MGQMMQDGTDNFGSRWLWTAAHVRQADEPRIVCRCLPIASNA
ncbi:hypothetical protein NY08_4967 [Rhodococcus sp. B7740]|nr:hypothetical protein NY08_4967 [Rhodococcus sp. B7740]